MFQNIHKHNYTRKITTTRAIRGATIDLFMDKSSGEVPYRQLGRQLKELRNRSHETLAEASGAVEIDVKQLASFELGRARPNEDVLLLLLSHFGAKDDEAAKLWDLAGYNMDKVPMSHMNNSGEQDAVVTLLATDPRIMFTDVVDVVVNKYGVVMNFMQDSGKDKKPISISRVGMSREHAKSVLKILQMTLNQTEQSQAAKKLISPDTQTPDINTLN